jgi:hypothetical protein
MRSVAQNLGVGTTETVRKWVRRPHSLPLSGRSDERALARIGATLVRDKGEHADVARQLAKISADSTRNAATVLHGERLSLRDIAHLLGVSFRRVHQILGEPLPAAALDSRHDAWDLALRAVREAEKADRDRTALRASLKHATKAEALASVHALEPARRQAAV